MKRKSELEKIVSALPPNPKKARKWSLEEDAVILKFTEDKGADAIGRAIGAAGIAVRRRFAFLKMQVGKK